MNVYLDAHDIGNGIHTMDFKVTLRTYSGSLADKFEAEKFLLTKPFVLIVDTEAPEPRLISMDTTRGTVDLSWDAYTKWNFQCYRIAKCKTSDPFSWLDLHIQ